ncbi:hypothetical protein Ancab_018122 [Ancistrocladus abbreviatus]
MDIEPAKVWGRLLYALVLLLCLLRASAARELAGKGNPRNTQIEYDHRAMDAHRDDDIKEMPHQRMNAHTPSSLASSDLDPSLNVFFKVEDVKVGKLIPLYFPIKDPSTTPNILPREEVDPIPFSSSQLPYLLDFFQLPPNSPQAHAMDETLKHCEFHPLEGETKFCANSLESMLENLRAIFGLGLDLKVLTTNKLKTAIPFQNYTVLSYKQVQNPRMIGCHPMPYPYAVFYCHGQQAADTKLYLMTLRSEEGNRIEAIGVCHMNTSRWDPNHAAFKVLGIEPGSAPVCHVSPPDSLVWIPSSKGFDSVV